MPTGFVHALRLQARLRIFYKNLRLGGVRMRIDGAWAAGQLVPPFADGGEHIIEVEF